MKTKHRRGSAKEYEDRGARFAIELFSQLKLRPGSAMTSEDIRARIETLSDEQLLQTTIGDFWLGITKDEGQARRRFDPPLHPFTVMKGKSHLGRKDEIEQWDARWRTLEAAAVYAKSGARSIRNIGMALRKSLPWLEHEVDGIIAAIDDITLRAFDQAMGDPAALTIKRYTLSTALRRSWRDPEERDLWLARLEAAHRLDEADIKKLALQDLADRETQQLQAARPAEPQREF